VVEPEFDVGVEAGIDANERATPGIFMPAWAAALLQYRRQALLEDAL
jgi:hypothetical protein